MRDAEAMRMARAVRRGSRETPSGWVLVAWWRTRRARVPATRPVEATGLVVPAPRSGEAAIDPTVGGASAVTLVGTRTAPASAYVVGASVALTAESLADPPAAAPHLPHVVHAVDSSGYPVCGAARTVYVLLHTVWSESIRGACEACASRLVTLEAAAKRPRVPYKGRQSAV
jgi:hypothetical protein